MHHTRRVADLLSHKRTGLEKESRWYACILLEVVDIYQASTNQISFDEHNEQTGNCLLFGFVDLFLVSDKNMLKAYQRSIYSQLQGCICIVSNKFWLSTESVRIYN